MIEAGVGQVVTWKPNMTNPRWLANLGQVGGLQYSTTLPGGCDQMQCTLFREPSYRTDGMDPGRVVQVQINGSVIWDGHMLEPVPQPGGWLMTAVGTAAWGTNYRAVYTGAWGSGVVDNAVNAAIARGLRWSNPGVGSPSGGWLGQAVDSAAQSVTDLLNLFCSNGGLTWYVAPKGNVLSVFALPATVTRLLICDSPVARTLGGNLNRVYERYQSSLDGPGGVAQFALTNSDDAASIALFGSPLEDYVDLSSVGLQTTLAAQTVGTKILQRYQRANFAGPFTILPGQLLTTGGQPVDLATEQAGGVYRLIITDYPYAGEQVTGPVQFLVGEYAYDSDKKTATATPFQSLQMDEQSALAAPWTLVDTKADVLYQRKARKALKAEQQRARARAARRRALHRPGGGSGGHG